MRLPVLMYHDITRHGEPGFLTVTLYRLEQQLRYIKEKGYQPVSLRQLYSHLTEGRSLPRKPVLLSFDDGFKSNFTYLYPLLVQYGLKAVVFLVGSYLNAAENNERNQYLHVNDIMQMDPAYIDYGLHSFAHRSYADLSIDEIDADLQKMNSTFASLNIPVVPLFAYPFGAFPKKNKEKMLRLIRLFDKHHIAGAFRIGNRINAVPVKNVFVMERIDVRGTDTFFKFKLMLWMGRKWLV